MMMTIISESVRDKCSLRHELQSEIITMSIDDGIAGVKRGMHNRNIAKKKVQYESMICDGFISTIDARSIVETG